MADDVTNQSNQQAAGPAPQSAQPDAHRAASAGAGSPGGSAGPDEGGRRGRRGGRRGGDDGGRRFGGDRSFQDGERETEEIVVKVYRCAKVVKGGRRFSFGALVVVGDHKGQVGIGYGKANEVPNAVEKATKAARRNMIRIRLAGTSIPHQVLGRFGASKVKLIPAGEGTGVIAGTSVRAVMELAGVKDVLTKCYGSTSPKNLVKAAFDGLLSLRSPDEVARLRAVTLVP